MAGVNLVGDDGPGRQVDSDLMGLLVVPCNDKGPAWWGRGGVRFR